jgi:hypothetical protein
LATTVKLFTVVIYYVCSPWSDICVQVQEHRTVGNSTRVGSSLVHKY